MNTLRTPKARAVALEMERLEFVESVEVGSRWEKGQTTYVLSEVQDEETLVLLPVTGGEQECVHWSLFVDGTYTEVFGK